MDFSLAATDSGPLHTIVFYCGESIFFTLMNRAGNIARHIQKFQYIESTSMHFKSKIFSDCSSG